MGNYFLITLIHPQSVGRTSDLSINRVDFAAELRKRWTTVEIHYPAELGRSLLDWEIQMPNREDDLYNGSLHKAYVSFRGGNLKVVAAFVEWFRAYIPPHYLLYFQLDGYSKFIELSSGAIAEEILRKMYAKWM